eukprot:352965-Chlamydomonas_euryale.AAC.30
MPGSGSGAQAEPEEREWERRTSRARGKGVEAAHKQAVGVAGWMVSMECLSSFTTACQRTRCGACGCNALAAPCPQTCEDEKTGRCTYVVGNARVVSDHVSDCSTRDQCSLRLHTSGGSAAGSAARVVSAGCVRMMLACGMQTCRMHTCGMQKCGVQAYKMHTCGMHVHDLQTCGMPTCGMRMQTVNSKYHPLTLAALMQPLFRPNMHAPCDSRGNTSHQGPRMPTRMGATCTCKSAHLSPCCPCRLKESGCRPKEAGAGNSVAHVGRDGEKGVAHRGTAAGKKVLHTEAAPSKRHLSCRHSTVACVRTRLSTSFLCPPSPLRIRTHTLVCESINQVRKSSTGQTCGWHARCSGSSGSSSGRQACVAGGKRWRAVLPDKFVNWCCCY